MRITFAVMTAALLTLVGCAQPRHPDTKIECRFASPGYPAVSRAKKEEGTTEVRAVIDRDGQITNITITKSSGYERLDTAALAAMRASACEPLYRNGERVPFSLRQPFRFALTD
ncbi:energy transducer TonB [Paraburkholderia sp. ZP32-5]|uniref:energy transducer TonB n=1 Tax=Paraburkholderia sp. ZP32-5 TaxID=2883245 RepID=UPI001F220785|nr:energy transducer TonB [Paraburkholderia sp. ZP32-5]